MLRRRRERVRVEELGQVLAALLSHPLLELGECGRLVDVLDRRYLGQGGDVLAELGDLQVGRVIAQLGHDLDLLLDELKARVEPRQDDEEGAQEDKHQDHRGGRRDAHDRVPPEALPGPAQAERNE